MNEYWKNELLELIECMKIELKNLDEVAGVDERFVSIDGLLFDLETMENIIKHEL